MTKRLFKIFLGIPVLYVILTAIPEAILELKAETLIENPETKNPLVMHIVFNFLIFFIYILLFYFITRTIFSKCGFSYSLKETIKKEWTERKNVWSQIKNDKYKIILIFILYMIFMIFYQFVWNSIFGRKKLSFYEYDFIICPVCEEFIFRKIYFDYCSKNSRLKHVYVLNVIIFALAHIIALPDKFIGGAMFTYCYKKYNSLLLNIAVHFLDNFIIILIFQILL